MDDDDNSISIPLARSVAPGFGISESKAKELSEEIQSIVRNNRERLAAG